MTYAMVRRSIVTLLLLSLAGCGSSGGGAGQPVDASGGGTGGAGGAVAGQDGAATAGVGGAVDTAVPRDARDGGGAGGAPAVDGAPGVDGPTGPGATVVDLVDDSAGMTLAIDLSGAIHVAAAAQANGQYTVIYGRCAGKCDLDPSWTVAVLPAESSTSAVPTIALTQDGRPRILFGSSLGAAPGFHYLECDSACDMAASWKDVRLTMDVPGANPALRPRLPFAVSPGGGAAFLYEDGFGIYAWTCKSSCGTGTSWSRVTIGGVYIYPESVAFASDQSLQVVARRLVKDDQSLIWIDCAGDCSSPASWGGVEGLWTSHGEVQAVVAATSQGGSRVAIYADDPTTPQTERVFAYLGCDSQCRMGPSWRAPLLLPLPPDAAGVGFSLALDGSGHPTLAYVSDGSSGYTSCTGDCATPAGRWQVVPGFGVADLNRWFPPTVPATCASGSWGMSTGPALALDARGKPVIASTASARGFGGQCGTGSAATTTASFLSLPP